MSYKNLADDILKSVNSIIFDKELSVEKIFASFLAGGHVLIEDVPGVGKTTLVKAFAKSMNLSFNRIQFTPDLMPSDITGSTILDRNNSNFVFKKGPIFNQIVLADEINRTSPKTQSSLLQAMEEGEVSFDDTTYTLVEPFMVLATQNPIEYQGTFPLPEAQLDRFIMRVSLGYPSAEKEINVIENYKNAKQMKDVKAVASTNDLIAMKEEVSSIHVSQDVLKYIVNITSATRISKDIRLGASPRASIDLCRSARSLAYLRGRNYVLPDDVKELTPFVLNHRMTLSAEARVDGKTIEGVCADILKSIYVVQVNAEKK